MHDYFQVVPWPIDSIIMIYYAELGALNLNLPWSLLNKNAVDITGNLWSEAYAGVVFPVFHRSQNHIPISTCSKYYRNSNYYPLESATVIGSECL